MEDNGQEQNNTLDTLQQTSEQEILPEKNAPQQDLNPEPTVSPSQLEEKKADSETGQATSSQTKEPVNPRPQEPNTVRSVGEETSINKETLWYLDNYILLRDYYERTISRIAARCVRMGNIALEEYPHYSYILDVLQEISDTGNYVIKHKELYPYVEKKIKGGIEGLRKNLKEYELELEKNSSPDMIKEDASAVAKMKKALGEIDVKDDPTKGAGMNMDALMDKLMKQNQVDTSQYESYDQEAKTPEFKPEKPKQN